LARRLAPRVAISAAAALAASGCAWWGAKDEPAPPPAVGTAAPGKPGQMSPQAARELDDLMTKRFAACWPTSAGASSSYSPAVRVTFKPDGSFAAPPRLVNTPTDEAERAVAQSALEAARRCEGKVPDRFVPFHAAWRTRVVRFAPGGG
jgi:hypothetical protein